MSRRVKLLRYFVAATLFAALSFFLYRLFVDGVAESVLLWITIAVSLLFIQQLPRD
jgi:hypothetical protein